MTCLKQDSFSSIHRLFQPPLKGADFWVLTPSLRWDFLYKWGSESLLQPQRTALQPLVTRAIQIVARIVQVGAIWFRRRSDHTGSYKRFSCIGRIRKINSRLACRPTSSDSLFKMMRQIILGIALLFIHIYQVPLCLCLIMKYIGHDVQISVLAKSLIEK